jgi:hypothetical protein
VCPPESREWYVSFSHDTRSYFYTTQESGAAIDSQFTSLSRSSSIIPELDDLARPWQLVEVADAKQEWDICDILGEEDVDGVPHY